MGYIYKILDSAIEHNATIVVKIKILMLNADAMNRMTSVVAVKNKLRQHAKKENTTENTTTNIATFERRQYTLSRQTRTLYL